MNGPNMVSRLLRRPVAVLSALWLLFIVVMSLVPSLVAAQDPFKQNLASAFEGPSSEHFLGTDMLGRDLLSRIAHGGAESLWGLVVALVVALTLGVGLGLVAGMYGGIADSIISRGADILFSLPNIVILLVVAAIYPSNMTITMAFFGALTAPGLIRIVRSAALATREEQFMAAAQVSGLSRWQILVRHLLPRLSSLIIVQASLIAALALVLQSGLGFLGFGAQPPQPSWGSLITDALAVIGRNPWALVPPGAAIGLSALALALLGDSVRDASTASWATAKLSKPSRDKRSSTTQPVLASDTASAEAPSNAVLSLRNLSAEIPIAGHSTAVVDNVSFDIHEGETLGIVGESGCGKSVTVLSILGMVPGGGQVTAGSCQFDGRDLFTMSDSDLRQVRGRGIGYVSQEPNTSLDPTNRVGAQVTEAVRRHTGLDRKAARARAIELLRQVRLPDPEAVFRKYPHQVSGGMAQRIAIAFALAGEPRLLIADEPTTALDVTVQAEILDLLRLLAIEQHMALLIVTHDWGVVADICDRAVVMYAGQIVESGLVNTMFASTLHPYAHGLLASNPALAPAKDAGRRLPTIGGAVPRPGEWPSGCRFAPRCSFASDGCRADEVALTSPAAEHDVRCIKPGVFVSLEVVSS